MQPAKELDRVLHSAYTFAANADPEEVVLSIRSCPSPGDCDLCTVMEQGLAENLGYVPPVKKG